MKPIMCRLPEEMHEELRKRAFAERVSIARLIRGALEEKYPGKPEISALSEPVLSRIWNNPDDAAYDDLR